MSTSTIASESRSGIQASNENFTQAFARGDAATLASLYTDNAQLLPAQSDFVTGRSAIQRFWQSVMDMGINAAVLETLEVESADDTAYEVGRYTLKVVSGEVADTGKYLVIWRRQGGNWKLHRDIWTTSRSA
jgi:uncharacterized protein (TIGR02246 family)